MDLQIPFSDGVNDSRILHEHFHATSDVQLDHLQPAVFLIETFEETEVFPAQCAEGHEPGVDEAEFLVVKGRCDAAAAGVAADDDVFDFQVLDRILDDGERVEVRWDDDVGDVAVAEDLARLETEDGGFGTAGVGASDPQDLGGLALAQAFEEGWVGFGEGTAPRAVVVEGAGVGVVWRDVLDLVGGWWFEVILGLGWQRDECLKSQMRW